MTAKTSCHISDCRGPVVGTQPLYRAMLWPEDWATESNRRDVPVCARHNDRAEESYAPKEPATAEVPAADPIAAQLTQAREKLAQAIRMGIDPQDRARLERRVNTLKNKMMRATAENASVAASAAGLARELNISVLDLVRTLAKGYGPNTRLSKREAAVLRTVYGR
jgi:hypothetical protein